MDNGAEQEGASEWTACSNYSHINFRFNGDSPLQSGQFLIHSRARRALGEDLVLIYLHVDTDTAKEMSFKINMPLYFITSSHERRERGRIKE